MSNLAPKYRHKSAPTPPVSRRQHSLKSKARLTALQLASHRLPPIAAQSSPPQRLLLLRPDHLGDLLFLTPSLRLLRQAFPAATITALVGPWGEAVLAANPYLSEVMLCDFPGFTRQAKPSAWQPYTYLQAQATRLRPMQFDMAIVFRFDHWWGAWLSALAAIPHRIGYDLPTTRPFLTHAVPYDDAQPHHEVVRNWQLAATAVQNYADPDNDVDTLHLAIGGMDYPISAVDRRWALERQAQFQTAAGPLVIIHPGAGAAVKLWRVKAWASLIDRLQYDFDACVALTGSPAERQLCEAIAAECPAVPTIVAGETTLSQLAALMQQAALVIGPDTGPLKLANALDRPTLQLYGPVDHGTFGPWGDPTRHQVVTAGLACQPCNHLDFPDTTVADHFCVRGLSVAAVYQAAATWLKTKP